MLEGIALWGELKPQLTHEAIVERALDVLRLGGGHGLLAIRSHVDVCDPRLLAVEALLEVKQRVAPYLDLQLVAFPQDGVLRSPGAHRAISKRALELGVDVVGGIPHFERTMARRRASVKLLCELAARARAARGHALRRNRRPDVAPHRDAGLETQRLGLQGRVTGSHLTSMHSMDNYYVSKLLPLMAEARRQRGRQSADQHHDPGPPRHLSRSGAA